MDAESNKQQKSRGRQEMKGLQQIRQYRLLSMKNEEQSCPVLYFLLQYNKFNQIIKAILNETISSNLLAECGYSTQGFSNLYIFKINESASRFSLSELIYLKGSSFQRVKEFHNKPLLDLLTTKIRVELPTAESRKALWTQFTDIYSKPHFYQQLEELELPTSFQIAIQKDILRTYKSPEVKYKTEQVLAAFAKYNPYVGYCQGMNSVIAFLIEEGFSAPQSFFIFKYITENLLPCQYYCSMDSVMAFMRIFYEMLNFTHPKCYARMKLIAKQMDNSYVAMVSFVLQWFVCLFCNDSIDPAITRVIWDFFLLEGIVVLFKAGLAMFDFLQPHIIKCSTYQQYANMQRIHIKQVKDYNHIRKRLISTFVCPQILFILKQKLVQQDEKSKKVDLKSRKPSKKKCSRKWNACLQALDKHLEENFSFQFFVFKPKGQLNIVDNYLSKIDKLYFNNEKSQGRADELRVGRLDHICEPEDQLFTDDSSSQKESQSSKERRKKYAESLSDPRSPIKLNEQSIRKKAATKVEEVMKRKPGMEKSESMIFMQKMVQNVSISNLLQLYEVDEMFQQ